MQHCLDSCGCAGSEPADACPRVPACDRCVPDDHSCDDGDIVELNFGDLLADLVRRAHDSRPDRWVH